MGNPIGIFDSGIGGLTVYQAIRKLLPSESLIYLGDTARVPYGTKSEETVRRYTGECLQFLLDKGVKMVVIACNTASAYALERLNGRCPVPLLGVILPGARAAVSVTKRNKIGVIGTEGTIRSGAYARVLRDLNPSIEVTSIACPLFVPLVEEGWLEGEIPHRVASQYLSPFREADIDTLILGCTHYPLLKPVLREVMNSVSLIDSAEETAKEVAQILKDRGLLTKEKTNSPAEFFVTDSPERFRRVGELFLGEPLLNVCQVEI